MTHPMHPLNLDPHPPHDRAPVVAFPCALLEGWRRTFVNRGQPYAVQQADGTYRWRQEACGRDVLAGHLSGALTLALSSTDARGWCRWICLDADAPDALSHLVALAQWLAADGLLGVVEASRRGRSARIETLLMGWGMPCASRWASTNGPIDAIRCSMRLVAHW
jgi:hypothetical protein